jgi:hypothetical protein
MSMVANAYMTSHSLIDLDIVDLLTTGFSGTLNNWWDDKHLTQESKTQIKTAVKIDDDGTPVLNDGKELLDVVNTLIYTIIKHFVGTPSNITACISNYFNNLKYLSMSDYRWYHIYIYIYICLSENSKDSLSFFFFIYFLYIIHNDIM